MQVFGPKLPPYLGTIIAASIGIPVVLFAGFEMWKNLQANRQARKVRQQQEAIDQVRVHYSRNALRVWRVAGKSFAAGFSLELHK